MMVAVNESLDTVGIAVVERETGIARETLRIWERRYGSPRPIRAPGGARLYSRGEIHRLRFVKALLDRGFKPAVVVVEDSERLAAMLADLPSAEAVSTVPDTVAEGLRFIEQSKPADFGRWLRRGLVKIGLRAFILDIVRPICRVVGERWQEGRLRIYQEHVATEQLQLVVRSAMQGIEADDDGPSALLTTLPGESHLMGLLMLEALLRLEGVACQSLGAQTPVDEIAACCADGSYDLVTLSFSASFPPRAVTDQLLELRSSLPQGVRLWAGGAGVSHLHGPRAPSGIVVIKDLEDAAAAMAVWVRSASAGIVA